MLQQNWALVFLPIPQYAAVADVWRFAKLVTLFLVILAQFVAKTACRAALCAVRLVAAKIASLAVTAFYASVVDAVWCIFVTSCFVRFNATIFIH